MQAILGDAADGAASQRTSGKRKDELVVSGGEVESFNAEVACSYRGESYRVRDNGAILRCTRLGQRKRPLDDTWTFGTPSASDGYMAISGHKLHRIVATAFHGEQPSKNHVVDHIDTNRRNNRPDNLRWVTRLENILLNPITAKRVEFLYGSIE
ncbi:MAG: HNH endonuclease signature motif containing protein [Tabrizicola sp.]|uniref:HNH endonuclease signature motif containing protein n=1 Tax=Tabrizicola sp. TaxID=2005166 RepID=UPI002ABC9408|nr:HNH endonuclease signature motif containing protein [Tabrizicola sp.]MDZ4087367.1 HNH endonuclease signature motif containing protein [Tabrizicola sp.]